MTTPLLLIHGLFGRLSDPNILSAFGDREVFAPDLLGYGENREVDTSKLALADQADHVAAWLRGQYVKPVHVVGHSIGGAVAMLLADRHPDLCASVTSIEGNFTLKDAFWSARIAQTPLAEVETIIAGYQADVPAWLRGAGAEPAAWAVEVAISWLHNQPASTIKAEAQAVVAATTPPSYLEAVKRIFESKPVYLIAGARARAGWDVPSWALEMAAGYSEIADTGHLMMLEKPQEFAQAVLRCAA
jgi:pimeloyl-ACP methyl ester carboxylesterase